MDGSNEDGICNKKCTGTQENVFFKTIQIYMGIHILILQRGLWSDEVSFAQK